jgi:hypothetical protein
MMKNFTIREYRGSFCLFDDNGKLVGEILHGYFINLKEKIKIDKEVYKIKYTGFLWQDMNVLNKGNKLFLRTDSSKDRIFYYGNYTEIYTYKYKDYKAYLYDNDDNLVLLLDHKKSFFEIIYKMEVGDNFNNDMVVLSFLNLYIRNSSGE